MREKNKVKDALKQSKKCKKCGGFLEPKFGDYHPICNPEKNEKKTKEICESFHKVLCKKLTECRECYRNEAIDLCRSYIAGKLSKLIERLQITDRALGKIPEHYRLPKDSGLQMVLEAIIKYNEEAIVKELGGK